MRSSRGVALLLTVMTMTVLIVAVSVVARSRTTEALVVSQAHLQVMADDLMRAAEVPVRQWLDEHASKGVVLDSSVRAPMATVTDQSMQIGGVDARVRVTAWDQQGMWPSNAQAVGLDGGPGLELPEAMSIAGLDAERVGGGTIPSVEHPDAPGGLVATHNPWPTRSGTTRSRAGAVINLNTTPAPLLEQVLGMSGLGDPGEVLARRDRGELSVVTDSRLDAKGMSIRLVSISRVWSLRVDVWVDAVRRSCWCVYANRGGEWVLSQRFVIHD